MEIPDRLYKYQPYSSYAFESLVQQKLWISNPDDFNDPFDSKVRIPEITSVDKIYDTIIAAYKRNGIKNWKLPALQEPKTEEESRELAEYAKDVIERVIRGVGVYSLTSSKDDVLMWAHYADSHRGFVIGFDMSKLKTYTNMEVVEVQYDDQYPEMCETELVDYDKTSDYLRKLASRKGKQWKYENEWRLIFPFNNLLLPFPMQPIEIIFGYKMQESHRNTLFQLITNIYGNLEFSTAKPKKFKFELDIHPYVHKLGQ